MILERKKELTLSPCNWMSREPSFFIGNLGPSKQGWFFMMRERMFVASPIDEWSYLQIQLTGERCYYMHLELN